MLLTIEKVILLKTVSIFSEVDENILTQVASILKEVQVKAGDAIITKDDMGRSLYIIVDGRVCIHAEEKTFAEIGERELFSEWSALLPEPRVASVTALEDTTLLCLDHDSLYEIMNDNFDVAKGIITHLVKLCREIRLQSV